MLLAYACAAYYVALVLTRRAAAQVASTHALPVKSLHIIFMVTWFAGLFYLPRLFVYHALARPTRSASSASR